MNADGERFLRCLTRIVRRGMTPHAAMSGLDCRLRYMEILTAASHELVQ
jgi:hypothetical protein